MNTEKKANLGLSLLVYFFVAFCVGGILMMGSSHPAPGTPVRSGQFTMGVILVWSAIIAFPLGSFFGLAAVIERFVNGRRRVSRHTREAVNAIDAPSVAATMPEEGDGEQQTVR